jgi:uncharacterized SAM-binding protein YcdF (DUF218 family)
VAERPGAGGRVVAVLGYSRGRDTELHPICAARLRYARRLSGGASAVILSGWARHRRTKPEAELMRAAWAGPDVPLVGDPDARSTAENVANVAATAAALGASELVVVTSRWHRRRTEIMLRSALRGRNVRLRVEGAPGPRPPAVLARELACYGLLPLQLHRARARGTRASR